METSRTIMKVFRFRVSFTQLHNLKLKKICKEDTKTFENSRKTLFSYQDR